jgi:hypothetical protein
VGFSQGRNGAEEPRGVTSDTKPHWSCFFSLGNFHIHQTLDGLVRLRSAPPLSHCGTPLTMTARIELAPQPHGHSERSSAVGFLRGRNGAEEPRGVTSDNKRTCCLSFTRRGVHSAVDAQAHKATLAS